MALVDLGGGDPRDRHSQICRESREKSLLDLFTHNDRSVLVDALRIFWLTREETRVISRIHTNASKNIFYSFKSYYILITYPLCVRRYRKDTSIDNFDIIETKLKNAFFRLPQKPDLAQDFILVIKNVLLRSL